MKKTVLMCTLASVISVSAASAGHDRTPLIANEVHFAATWQNPVNRNLYRIAVCETGGKRGQAGKPDWNHVTRSYAGALGFRHSTWKTFRWNVKPVPPARAYNATPAQQYAVARSLVREYRGYSSWPDCSRRLGLR